ncbi:MAG TPA: cytochrome d ubiquinol oxidase subunit II [Actinomycetota bacterium]|nr:cytochrome d ubiquinol oxidase subunit II [Actinomycetota bacterium]
MQNFWFIVIALFFTGFFVLEGFDFGVGMLHGIVGKTDAERRLAINTIGPLWDGNEVWLIVAGAGMFAAFPSWYATMFSGMYLALVLVLVALILRGVSFEYRGKRDGQRWRRTWDWSMSLGSLVAPLLLGVALGDLLYGLPIDSSQEFTGSFWSLLTPYGVFVGLSIVSICVLHGATFLSLRTTPGDVHDRAARLARRTAPVTALVVLVMMVWTQIMLDKGIVPGLIQVGAVLALIAVTWLIREGREGSAFAMTTIAMAATILTIFIDLYPRVMVSSTSAANDLTVTNTSSSPYALKVMTIVAVLFFPLVVVYQAWSYHVFRRRIGTSDLEHQGAPGDAASAAAPAATGE